MAHVASDERRRGRIEVLRRVTGPPESLERRLGECRDLRTELRRHGILHSHVRPVAASGAQSLPGQECFRGHPVCVVSSDESTIHVTTRQSRGGSSLDPQHRPTDQSLCQRSEILCVKTLQTVPVDEELNGPKVCPRPGPTS